MTLHPHGTWGTVGAAVAAAVLKRLDASTLIEVINVASSLGITTSRRAVERLTLWVILAFVVLLVMSWGAIYGLWVNAV